MKARMDQQGSLQNCVEKAQTGDRAAFDDIVKRYKERLLTALELNLPPPLRARSDKEEILQETLFRAFQSIGRFEWRGEESLYLWLNGIARNVAREQAKDARKRQDLPQPELVPTEDVSPSRLMRRHERFDRLASSLSKLKPEYQEVLRLARIEGLKVRDIARRMDRSEFAVKHLMARAIRQLQELFGDTESLHLPDRTLGQEEVDDAE